jgi:GTP-binding protein
MGSSFIDKARITVRAGNGGDGVVAFHREKYVAAGGPDGGDGGRGGSIILQADDNMSTLMDFRYKRKYVAESGMSGQSCRKSGKDGADLIIRVPVGTLVRDAESGEIMQDLSSREPYVLCKGGRGGWGNMHFATPTRQVPRFAKGGLPGEAHEVILELKLLADVGLIGFPNVGKSTLLSVVSKAQPKIANYHFTTLYPNLGVVYVDDGVSFVMADIPGIIEGAADGAGLGHDFLRHIDRCRLLVHVVDVSGSEGRDPVADFDAINEELKQYSPDLAKRPQIVAANKVDIMADPGNLERLRQHVEAQGCQLYTISAAAHQGTRELVQKVGERLAVLPPVRVFEADYVPKPPVIDTNEPLNIQRTDDGHTWLVDGPWLQRIMGNVNFSDYESRMYFDKTLRESGLFERLEEMGIEDGDTVSMYNFEFEYQR